MERRGLAKRVRGLTSKLLVDEDKRALAKQARLEALESGIDEDAFQVDDDDDEFELEAEVDEDASGRSKSRKKKSGTRKIASFHGMPAASSFMVLLEESGMYENKVPEPHYLSAEAELEPLPARDFCNVCGNVSSYRCVRCREPFCSKRCQVTHSDVQCVKLTL